MERKKEAKRMALGVKGRNKYNSIINSKIIHFIIQNPESSMSYMNMTFSN